MQGRRQKRLKNEEIMKSRWEELSEYCMFECEDKRLVHAGCCIQRHLSFTLRRFFHDFPSKSEEIDFSFLQI